MLSGKRPKEDPGVYTFFFYCEEVWKCHVHRDIFGRSKKTEDGYSAAGTDFSYILCNCYTAVFLFFLSIYTYDTVYSFYASACVFISLEGCRRSFHWSIKQKAKTGGERLPVDTTISFLLQWMTRRFNMETKFQLSLSLESQRGVCVRWGTLCGRIFSRDTRTHADVQTSLCKSTGVGYIFKDLQSTIHRT